jgi:hypothetical protein
MGGVGQLSLILSVDNAEVDGEEGRSLILLVAICLGAVQKRKTVSMSAAMADSENLIEQCAY